MVEDTYSLPKLEALKKESIGQTYQNLNKLLKGKSVSQFQNVNDIVSTTEKISKFEESLRLIIIDSLNLEKDVLNILLSQDNYKIQRILGCNWFFENCLKPEQLCNEILPHVSVSLRNKLITKLSKKIKNSDDAEKLMKFVQDNYSQDLAELFLPKCKPSVIRQYITGTPNVLKHNKNSKIMLLICRKHPSLVIDILSFLLKRNNGQHVDLRVHEKALLFLAGNHTDVFVPFFRENYSKLMFLRFGVKLSQKLGPKLKEDTFNVKELVKSSIFNQSAFFKVLSFDDKVKFLTAVVLSKNDKLTLSNWSKSEFELTDLVKLVKPNQRLQMVEVTFNKIFKLQIKNFIKRFGTQIMELVPLDQRLPYVEAYEAAMVGQTAEDPQNCEFQSEKAWDPPSDPENYVYLYPFDVSFTRYQALLKKMPNLTRRQDILQLMVRSCAINKDTVNLKQLTEFTAARFRNDSPQVFIQFAFDVFRNFPLSKIDLETIEKIEEMLHLCYVKNERNSYGYLIEKCVLHRLGRGLNVDAQVKQIVEWKVSEKMREDLMHSYDGDKSWDLFYLYYQEILRWMNANPSNPDNAEKIPNWILRAVMGFNRVQEEKIVLSKIPELVPALKRFIDKHNGDLLDETAMGLVLETPFKFMHAGSKPKLIKFLLKHHPHVIVTRLKNFVESIHSHFGSAFPEQLLLSSIRVLSFYGAVEKLKEILRDDFQNGESVTKKKNALAMLSYLCEIDEFEKLVQEYLPKTDKIDGGAPTDFVQIQLFVPRVIKNITPSWKNLNFILSFFTGDYLREVLLSFYKCCYHTRTDHLIENLLAYLEKISKNGRLAAKKEVIRSLVLVSNTRQGVDICSRCWDLIDHYSIRTILFKRMSRMFVEKPSAETFEIVKKFVAESDELVIEARPNIGEVPRQFFKDYVLSVWDYSEKQVPKLRNQLQESLLSGFTLANIPLLPNEFCEKVIKTHLCKSDVEVRHFAARYILAEPVGVDSKLTFVLRTLKDFMTDTQVVGDFIKILRSTSFGNPEAAAVLFDSLIQSWPYTARTVLPDEYLVANYYNFYYKVFGKSDDNIDEKSTEFGRKVKHLYQGYESLEHMTTIILDSLQSFYPELKAYGQKFNLLRFLKELLGEPHQPCLAVLVILALPYDLIKLYTVDDMMFDSMETSQRGDLNQIVQQIRNYPDEVVKMYFRRRFGFKKSELEALVSTKI